MPSAFSIKVKYYDGSVNKVDASTKSSVKRAVEKAVAKINSDFFKGLSFHVASDFSNLDEHNYFSKFNKKNQKAYSSSKGLTWDIMYEREIYIQESSFCIDKLLNIFSGFQANKEIEQATMHEIGHQFDYYYGCTADLRQKHDLLAKKYYDKPDDCPITQEEEKFMKYYNANNGCSDKKDFMEALHKDLQSFRWEKWNITQECRFAYILAEFYLKGKDKVPSMQDIKDGDYCRGEVFAQLFSYAMGTDNGAKQEVIKQLPNTYRVVQKYIKMHSKK